MAAIKRRAQGEVDDGQGEASKILRVPAELDGAKVVLYQQHVRALNSQFASWVQQQLKEHPGALWKEGVQDYLQYASKILEDFRDVVGSNKDNANSSLVSSSPQNIGFWGASSGSNLANKQGPIKSNVFFGQPVLPPFSLPPPTATSSGLPTLNIPSQGTTAQLASINNGDDTQEDDDAQNEPSSPSVKRIDEPGIKVVHEIKCKLYIKGEAGDDKAWKDMGMGNLILKCKEGTDKGTKEAKSTIVVRNEVGRILLNALLYPKIKMNIQKNTVTGIFHSAETENRSPAGSAQESEASRGRLYLFKLKTANDAEKLAEAITGNAPAGD